MDDLIIENERTMKLFEEELIKLKTLLDQKDTEISGLQSKIRKIENDHQFEINEQNANNLKLKD
jgi:succinate dehydrogenase flavin-adding protein (antitoxin of CptAB toxin-antitoxin module)